MKIGVTYAPALDKEWPKIKKLIDIVEIANLSHFEKSSGRPWTYHFRFKDPFNPESGSLNLLKLDEIRTALEKSREVISRKKPEIISVHLGKAALEITKDPIDNHSIATSAILPRSEVMERLSESVDYLLQFTQDPGIILAVENLDYHSGGAYEYICEPVFITEILAELPNLRLLLDIAHAEISAVNFFGVKPEERIEAVKRYLRYLPLNRIIEIHINSPIWEGESPLDMHWPITKIEKRLLKDLVSLPDLRIINLECESNLKIQLKYLRKEVR